MLKLDHDSEALPINKTACPATLASNDEMIAITVAGDIPHERYRCALQCGFLTKLRAWLKRAVITRRDFRESSFRSITPAKMFEDEIWCATADQPKTHSKTSIVGPRVPNRRIISK